MRTKCTAMEPLKKNIYYDYIYCFIRNFDICNAIWVLYMVYRGLPLWQIGIAEGVFHVAGFLFEVPSGAIADLLGRKKVMIVGRICYGIAGIIQLYSCNLLGFCIAFIISAFSYNLNSGSEEALVYDSMKAVGNEAGYMKVNSRLNVLIEIAQGLSVLAGGMLAEYSYVLCYGVSAGITMLSLIPAFMLHEPPRVRQGKNEEEDKTAAAKKMTVKEHFHISVSVIKSNPQIRKVLVYFPVVTTFSAVVYFYGQQYYAEMGFNKVEISIIMFLCGIAGCLGALSSDKLIIVLKGRLKYICSFVMGCAILVICIRQPYVSIAAFVLVSYCTSLLYPIQSVSLNVLIPSNQRATLISVQNMFFSLAMICLFPLSGLAATVWNLQTAFIALGMMQIVMMAVIYCIKKCSLPTEGKEVI